MRLTAALPLLAALSLSADADAKSHHHKSAARHHAASKHHPPVAHGKAAKPARPAAPSAPEILLTFDDGPSLERTPKVLDVLDKHHIKAVFFVNGVHFQGTSPAAEKARALLRETRRRGHYIGNHTVHHLFLCGKRGPRVAADEITRNADLIEAAVGVRPQLFRTPYGSHCPSLSATLATLGLKHTGWDIDPQDWKVHNTAIVRDYVIRQLQSLRGRAIILFHDVHQDTVEALPQVLDWLDKENAARATRGGPPIKILDYGYLLSGAPAVVPAAAPPAPTHARPSLPFLESLGRAILAATPLARPPLSALGRLAVAWLPGS